MTKIKFTVRKANRLYVRKTLTVAGGSRRQIWRVCEPATESRAKEILTEIEAEILSRGDESKIELAKIFLKVRGGEMGFEEFKNKARIIGEAWENKGF